MGGNLRQIYKFTLFSFKVDLTFFGNLKVECRHSTAAQVSQAGLFLHLAVFAEPAPPAEPSLGALIAP